MKNRKGFKIFTEIILFISLPILLDDFGVLISSVIFLHQIWNGKELWLFKSLFYLFIYRYLNPILYEPGIVLNLSSWVLLFSVFLATFRLKNSYSLMKIKYFFVFIVISLISSFLKSEYLMISVFKLASFFIGFYSIYKILGNIKIHELLSFLMMTWIVVLLFSIPTLIISSVGYERNFSGFQGITSHPNFFGPFNAVIGGTVLILNNYLKFIKVSSVVNLFFVFINLYLVILSESRTALFVIAFSSIITVLFNDFINNGKVVYILFGFIFFLVAVNSLSFSNSVKDFLIKDRSDIKSELTFEQLTNSRADLVNTSIKNFYNNPLIGIGFSSPNDFYEFEIKYFGNTKIPYSAAIEKGNLFTQVLEETGVLGFFAFILFITSVILRVYRNNPSLIGFVIAPIILNLGEATFFSVNGLGVFLWVFFLFPFFLKENEVKEIFNNKSQRYPK